MPGYFFPLLAAPVLQVVIYSNTDLPEDEFRAQTEKLRRVASYDNATRSWYGQIPFDRPEWAAEMLTALFDVARLHGTVASGYGCLVRSSPRWPRR